MEIYIYFFLAFTQDRTGPKTNKNYPARWRQLSFSLKKNKSDGMALTWNNLFWYYFLNPFRRHIFFTESKLTVSKFLMRWLFLIQTASKTTSQRTQTYLREATLLLFSGRVLTCLPVVWEECLPVASLLSVVRVGVTRRAQGCVFFCFNKWRFRVAVTKC